MTISKDYKEDQTSAEVDMSADAVTARLKRVSQLRRLCVSLGKAKISPADSEVADDLKINAQNNNLSDS